MSLRENFLSLNKKIFILSFDREKEKKMLFNHMFKMTQFLPSSLLAMRQNFPMIKTARMRSNSIDLTFFTDLNNVVREFQIESLR